MENSNLTVAIVGLGGLGGYVCEYISRLNIKKIVLIDKDSFSESNINRQLLCTKKTIGTLKIENYKSKIQKISDIEVVTFNEFLDESNSYVIDGCDLVFDCLDNIKSRLILSKACEMKNIPLIHGSIGDNFGNVCLCLPGNNMIEKIYKNSDDIKLPTNAYSVAFIASIQVNLAKKYLNNDYKDFVNVLLHIDLDNLEIKKMKI